jgi:hypothetical protein
MKAPSNRHEFRESWLRAAANELRPYFASCGYPLPDNIRLAIAFPSTGKKGKRLGECWHSGSSEDGAYEIFIRADISEPVEVLSVLVKELVHAAIPAAGVSHGKLFKPAAIKIGLQGKMRDAKPGVLLQTRLTQLAETLGPLPHARLHIAESPLVAVAPIPAAIALDRPKKQRTRWLKAECEKDDCGYTVRVSAKQARDVGPPHCPKHGPMRVDLPPLEELESITLPDAATAGTVHTPLEERAHASPA